MFTPDSPATPPPRRHPVRTLILITAGLLAAVAAGVTAWLALTAAPSWPHPWCGETMTAMYDSPRQTFGQFTNELQYLSNVGAPTDQLLADEQSLSSDQASAASSSLFQLGPDLTAEQADMTAIGADARQLNTACGKPAGYKLGQLAVPAGQ